ncbi:MAG: hypothetical protein EBQ80_01700 [Proteobacteria bacterium]|nr:hypothetical protein [Pseudomonadota bacterium]
MSQNEWNSIWARARERKITAKAISRRLSLSYHIAVKAQRDSGPLTLTAKQWGELAELLGLPALRKYASDNPQEVASPSSAAAANLSILLEMSKEDRAKLLDLADDLKKEFPEAARRKEILAILTALLA